MKSAATTAYLREIIMIQSREQGLARCSSKETWGNQREKEKRWIFIIASLEYAYFHAEVGGSRTVEADILQSNSYFQQKLSLGL